MPMTRLYKRQSKNLPRRSDHRRREEEEETKLLEMLIRIRMGTSSKRDNLACLHQRLRIILTADRIKTSKERYKIRIKTEKEAMKRTTILTLPLENVANPFRNLVRNLVLDPLNTLHVLPPLFPIPIPPLARNLASAVVALHQKNAIRTLSRLPPPKQLRIHSITGNPQETRTLIDLSTQIAKLLSLVSLAHAAHSFPIRSGCIHSTILRYFTDQTRI